MKTSPEKRKLIICAVLLAVFTVIAVGSVLLIGMDTANAVPDFIKLVLFLGGSVGVLLFFGMTVSLAVKLAVSKANEKAMDNRLIAAGLKQNPREDVIRKPIEPDDEEGFKELEEHTEKFFAGIVYPDGFEEFLKRLTAKGEADTLEKGETVPDVRYVERGGEYFEIADVYQPSEIIGINRDFLLYCDDYHTQFRDILFFADDESGHCHFLLDYGKGGEPTVKYLDDEADTVRTIAENFKDFAGRIKECTYGQFSKLLEEYEKNKLKR